MTTHMAVERPVLAPGVSEYTACRPFGSRTNPPSGMTTQNTFYVTQDWAKVTCTLCLKKRGK